MAELLQDDHPWIREYFHGPRGRAAAARAGAERMETRASYIAVGAFVLVLILGLVGFVIWVGKFRGAEQFARYDILFAGSVTGLQVDGTVRYRGIPVGRIIDIRIDPRQHRADPRHHRGEGRYARAYGYRGLDRAAGHHRRASTSC